MRFAKSAFSLLGAWAATLVKCRAGWQEEFGAERHAAVKKENGKKGVLFLIFPDIL
jgi:hypothetical protein